MTKLRTLVAGVVIAALAFIGGLYAQQLTSRTLTGLETWQIATGGPGGPSIFTTSAQIRNATGVVTTALTTGTLASITNTTASTLVSLAASSALVVNLPATPWDGEIFEWTNGSAAAFTGGSVAVTDGSTIVNGATGTAITTLAPGASVEFRYVLTTNSWYKVR